MEKVSVSLEQFVEGCQEIRRLATEAEENRCLPYVSAKGLRSGMKIIKEVIGYFNNESSRKSEDDISILQMAEFGLQTLRDSCMIAEEEGRGGILINLRAIINTMGAYSIKTDHLDYSFSRVVISSRTN